MGLSVRRLLFRWGSVPGSTAPVSPNIIDATGSYVPILSISGSVGRTDVTGSYVPYLDLEGSA